MWIRIGSGTEGGSDVEITGDRFVIGRDESCDLVVADEKASRQHAVILAGADGRLTLQDLGSTNGTYVDGRRLSEPIPLSGGERITIGDTLLRLSAVPETGTATATSQTPAAPPTQRAEAPAREAAGPPRPAATPSRIERVLLRQSVRRAQLLAAAAGAGVLIAVAVVLLFVMGAIGGDDDSSAPTVPEIIATVTPSTVQIRGIQDGQSFGLGTGWVYDAEQGLIVTNSHVTNEAAEFAVSLGDERRERTASLVGVAPCDDLAVLKVEDTSGMQTLPLGSQSTLEQGDDVVALGYPVSLSATDELIATTGVVSVVKTRSAAFPDLPRYRNVVQTDAVINPGNSGGPLVNADLALVGVNTLSHIGDTIEGQHYAIGVDRVKEVVPQLAQGRSLGWTGMGFVYPQQESDLTDLSLPAVAGLIVARAVPGTAAAEAGFGQTPALLVGIDGRPIDNTLRSYCNAVGDFEQGETATFTVVAQGNTEAQDVSLTFE